MAEPHLVYVVCGLAIVAIGRSPRKQTCDPPHLVLVGERDHHNLSQPSMTSNSSGSWLQRPRHCFIHWNHTTPMVTPGHQPSQAPVRSCLSWNNSSTCLWCIFGIASDAWPVVVGSGRAICVVLSLGDSCGPTGDERTPRLVGRKLVWREAMINHGIGTCWNHGWFDA